MCGIIGIYNLKKGKKTDRKIITKMTNSLIHRGPDDFGIYIDKNMALGSRRLSIIDLTKKAHQPMSDESKNIWIVLNGEIYNFKEIKKDLEKKYKFKSNSDTEVIIYAYKEWGIGCVEKFNGMFAFALYDKNKDLLYVVRDRLGIKPLFFTKFNDKFIFASEVKAILNYPKFKRELNMRVISSYLSYRYVLGEETLFKNIFKLLPGHYLKIRQNKIEKIEYWDIPIKNLKDKGKKHYSKKVRELMEDSVKKRLISDVPLGSYLSGGLDSSVIVSIMSKLKEEPIKTFSIGFKEKGFDEFKYSKMIVDTYKTDHKEIILSAKGYLETMRKLIKFKDLPLGVPNEIPLYLMSKELKKYITVVLSGEGADEIFCGYGRIQRVLHDYYMLKIINKFPKFIKKIFFNSFVKKYKNQKFNDEIEAFLYSYSYFPLEEKKFIFNDEMNKTINNDLEIKEIFTKYFNRAKKLSRHNKMPYIFAKLHLPGLLARADNSTMATSVEARVPFIDHRLVEFMISTPLKYKMKWKSSISKIKSFFRISDEIQDNLDITKYILREAFRDDLPEEILIRRKMAFPVPLDIWFKSHFVNYAKKMLLRKNAKTKIFLNQNNLKKWIDNNLIYKKDEKFGQKLWMLINLEIWMEEYF